MTQTSDARPVTRANGHPPVTAPGTQPPARTETQGAAVAVPRVGEPPAPGRGERAAPVPVDQDPR
ncbi:MAG: hypothetical protein ACRDVE_17885, partial [Actinocrinis sp.]